MRPAASVLGVLVVLASTVGCAPESHVALQHRSTLQARTVGVALHDEGIADAGMADAICVIDTHGALVIGDRDLSEGNERVLDAHRGLALSSADLRLHALSAIDLASDEDLGISAVDGRILDDGFAALTPSADCTIAYSTSTGTTGWTLDGTACDAEVGFAVDRSSGIAWLADGSTVAALTPAGDVMTMPGADADHVAWDAASGLAILTSDGSDLVRGVGTDGVIAWAVQVDGTVHDVATAGEVGLVVVTVAQPEGGEVVILDGLTGEQIVSHLVPEVPDVEISADGLSIGLVTPDAVHFYGMDPDADPLESPTTETMVDLRGMGAGTALLWGAAVAAVVLD